MKYQPETAVLVVFQPADSLLLNLHLPLDPGEELERFFLDRQDHPDGTRHRSVQQRLRVLEKKFNNLNFIIFFIVHKLFDVIIKC